MANMIDYIKWRGDLTFKDSPFNEVDNIILSQMIYTEFDEYIKEDEKISVLELSNRYFKHHTIKEAIDSKSFIHLAPTVLFEMSKSIRFKDLMVHHFKSVLDRQNKIQFAAMHIDLNNNETYIAFRGTDDTLIGWREDFDMTYKVVPSQCLALDYLKDTFNWRKKYYLGGHSKGGNLVAYAAMKMDPKLFKKVILVYDNDGPGLSDEMFSIEEYKRVLPKLRKIVPSFDIIGTIFDPTNDHIVVESDAIGAYQHDAMSWQILGTNFVYKDEITQESQIFRDTLKTFLASIDKNERKVIIDEVFNTIDEVGIKNVSDFYTSGIKTKVALMKNITKFDKETQTVLTRLIGSFFGSYSEEIKQKVKSTIAKATKSKKEEK